MQQPIYRTINTTKWLQLTTCYWKRKRESQVKTMSTNKLPLTRRKLYTVPQISKEISAKVSTCPLTQLKSYLEHPTADLRAGRPLKIEISGAREAIIQQHRPECTKELTQLSTNEWQTSFQCLQKLLQLTTNQSTQSRWIRWELHSILTAWDLTCTRLLIKITSMQDR